MWLLFKTHHFLTSYFNSISLSLNTYIHYTIRTYICIFVSHIHLVHTQTNICKQSHTDADLCKPIFSVTHLRRRECDCYTLIQLVHWVCVWEREREEENGSECLLMLAFCLPREKERERKREKEKEREKEREFKWERKNEMKGKQIRENAPRLPKTFCFVSIWRVRVHLPKKAQVFTRHSLH